MNNNRRKAIAAIHSNIESLKSEIESLLDEEQNYYDNMPQSLQDGTKGNTAQEAIDALESALGCAEEVIGYLEQATAV